jgi:hypothetical protein
VSRNRYLALCALVLTGAFAGGFAANLAIPVAHAQDVVGPANVRGTGFTLVNPQGKVQATLRSGPLGAELIFNDPNNGGSRVEIGATGGIVIHDANGRVTWRSPRGMGILPATE